VVAGGTTTAGSVGRCSWSTRSRGCFPAQVSGAASSVEVLSRLLFCPLCGFSAVPTLRRDAAPKRDPPRIRRHPVQLVRRVRPVVPQGECALRIPIGERRRLGRGLPADVVRPEGILRRAGSAAGQGRTAAVGGQDERRPARARIRHRNGLR